MFAFLLRVRDSLRTTRGKHKHFVEELRARDLLLTRESTRLAVTLRSIWDAVVTTDPEGRVTMLNKVAEDLTGWPRMTLWDANCRRSS